MIFYLQMNHQFPKLKDLPLIESKFTNISILKPEQKTLNQLVVGFFEFYAKRYEVSNHLISLNIGRWQEKQMHSDQTKLTPEQKRFYIYYAILLSMMSYKSSLIHSSLRDAMKSNAANWKDCAMFVQDIKSHGTNITAEISKEEVTNFKKMCQLFFADNSQKRFIDEYVTKFSIQPFSNKCFTANKSNNSQSISMVNNRVTEKLPTDGTVIPLNSGGYIKLADVTKLAVVSMKNLLRRSENEIRYEVEILRISYNTFITVYPFLRVALFGSRRYCHFGSIQTNLNILLQKRELKKKYFHVSYFFIEVLKKKR